MSDLPPLFFAFTTERAVSKMAGGKPKAKMACSVEDVEACLKNQFDFQAECEDLFNVHLEESHDDEWNHKDGPGMTTNLRSERAQLKLVLTIEFDEETGRPRFPPPNTRLSDELVYLAEKHMKNTLRGQRYPYDFDKRGDIDPDRVPSGPAPIIWAHGLPFFPVYKGYYVLCGRDHALCMGWLIAEKTKSVMKDKPHWSIGAVVAPKSAVRATHTVDRQISLHSPWGPERDLRYKGKHTSRDVVSADHHDCALLPRLDKDVQVRPLWAVPGYNARCGPQIPGTCPTFVRESFFVRHELEDKIDYDHMCRKYSNIYADPADDTGGSDEGTDLWDTEMTDEPNIVKTELVDSEPDLSKPDIIKGMFDLEDNKMTADPDLEKADVTEDENQLFVTQSPAPGDQTKLQLFLDAGSSANYFHTLSSNIDDMFTRMDQVPPITFGPDFDQDLVWTDVPENEIQGSNIKEQSARDQTVIESPKTHQNLSVSLLQKEEDILESTPIDEL
jgi:hypothetical protein